MARVRRMLDAYMRFAFANPNAYQVVYCSSHGALSEGQLDSMRATSDRCYELFVCAVNAIAQAGRLKGEAETAAQVTWTACHGLVSLLIVRPNFVWAEREALMSLMLDGLLDGLVTA